MPFDFAQLSSIKRPTFRNIRIKLLRNFRPCWVQSELRRAFQLYWSRLELLFVETAEVIQCPGHVWYLPPFLNSWASVTLYTTLKRETQRISLEPSKSLSYEYVMGWSRWFSQSGQGLLKVLQKQTRRQQRKAARRNTTTLDTIFFIINSLGLPLNFQARHLVELLAPELLPQALCKRLALHVLQQGAQLLRAQTQLGLRQFDDVHQSRAALLELALDLVDEVNGGSGESGTLELIELALQERQFADVLDKRHVLVLQSTGLGENGHEIVDGGSVDVEVDVLEDVGLHFQDVMAVVGVRAEVDQLLDAGHLVGLLKLGCDVQTRKTQQLEFVFFDLLVANVSVDELDHHVEGLWHQLQLVVDVGKPVYQNRSHRLVYLGLLGEEVLDPLVLLAEEVVEYVATVGIGVPVLMWQKSLVLDFHRRLGDRSGVKGNIGDYERGVVEHYACLLFFVGVLEDLVDKGPVGEPFGVRVVFVEDVGDVLAEEPVGERPVGS